MIKIIFQNKRGNYIGSFNLKLGLRQIDIIYSDDVLEGPSVLRRPVRNEVIVFRTTTKLWIHIGTRI